MCRGKVSLRSEQFLLGSEIDVCAKVLRPAGGPTGSSVARTLEKAGSPARGLVRAVDFFLNQEAAIEGLQVGSDSI